MTTQTSINDYLKNDLRELNRYHGQKNSTFRDIKMYLKFCTSQINVLLKLAKTEFSAIAQLTEYRELVDSYTIHMENLSNHLRNYKSDISSIKEQIRINDAKYSINK
jgi:hypothetical protein